MARTHEERMERFAEQQVAIGRRTERVVKGGLLFLAVLLGGCDFSGPQIVDETGKTVRVRYVNTGSRDLDTKAMQLIAQHCGERGFRIAHRTVEVTYRNVRGAPTQINIDAVCL